VRTWIHNAARITHSHQRAWQLASAALDRPIHALWTITPTKTERARLDHCLAEYIANKPLTRIREKTEFYGYTFRTSPAVLDPRPETEMIVQHAVECNPRSILDLGTGSGCILCSVMATLHAQGSHPRGLGTDISPDALEIAKHNAQQLGVTPEFRLSDWCARIDEKFDLVVSNPPYISTTAQLPTEVWAYDPPIALYGGVSGTHAHYIALPQLPPILNPNATVLWEIGHDQRDWILNFAHKVFIGAREIDVLDDYNQLPRMLRVRL
jgi:release factor glutamine methyltransferase